MFYEQERQTFCIVNIPFRTTNCLKNRNGFYTVDHTFSTDSNYLVVLQSEGENDPTDARGDRIIVYDLHDYREYFSISEHNINNMWFLNDSNSLIYMRGQTTPCIVDLVVKTKKCINAIPARYPGRGISLNGVSSDGKSLEFLYWGINELSGGLCFYDLVSGMFNCPADGLPVLKNNILYEYALSPDGKYVSFIYANADCPHCDGGSSYSGLALVGIDGHNFIDLGISDPELNLVSTWRPSASAQTNP